MIVRKILFIVAIISALGISTIAAEEVVDHSEMSQTEHQGEQEGHESEQTEHQGEQDGHESKQTEQTEQGHHKEVVEIPPNYKVLGGFAIVNLLFIMIGVYMKWFYRKGAST